MQIDMHFAGTYIVARAAGFPDDEARVIANSAQYVDDSVTTGFVRFDNAGVFQRTATANTMASLGNLNELNNHLAWLPFHFLPGDMGQGHPERLICRPNSEVAKDMVAESIVDAGQPWFLHRYGITAHVFCDTFAHQGFAGMIHQVNGVTDLTCHDGTVEAKQGWLTRLQNWAVDSYNKVRGREVAMLGHGLAQTFPDLPWLRWSYVNGLGQKVERDNLAIFTEALDELCGVFRRFRAGDPFAKVEARLPEPLRSAVIRNLDAIRDLDAHKRLERWLQLLAEDAFGLGKVDLRYDADSWRHTALKVDKDFDFDALDAFRVVAFPEGFLESNWKLFHDAAKDHRHAILRRILPRYNLCAS